MWWQEEPPRSRSGTSHSRLQGSERGGGRRGRRGCPSLPASTWSQLCPAPTTRGSCPAPEPLQPRPGSLHTLSQDGCQLLGVPSVPQSPISGTSMRFPPCLALSPLRRVLPPAHLPSPPLGPPGTPCLSSHPTAIRQDSGGSPKAARRLAHDICGP